MGSRAAVFTVLLAACANAGDRGPAPGTPDAPTQITPPPDAPPSSGPQMCPPGQLATDVSAAGEVTCATYDADVAAAISASCSVYLGWRDDCDGCITPPAKWGRAGTTCTNVGTNTRCTTQMLGGVQVSMFGLDFDGDVDNNDKIYGSLHCTQPPETTTIAPCAPGQLVTGKSGSTWTCAPIAVAAAAYVRDNCSLYLGWRDNCDGCTTVPAKWGYAGSTTCQNGIGVNNTCTTATLGTESVRLFGLNTDGDVDGNDKIHAGLHCTPPTTASTTAQTTCPAGQFVSGTTTDGALQCESPAAAFHQYFSQRCTLYVGWRDNCDGCTTAPAKWGQTSIAACTVGLGADNTCSEHMLGTQTVRLFGLNPDGDVDGNDMLYIGLRCN